MKTAKVFSLESFIVNGNLYVTHDILLPLYYTLHDNETCTGNYGNNIACNQHIY